MLKTRNVKYDTLNECEYTITLDNFNRTVNLKSNMNYLCVCYAKNIEKNLNYT